jgi:hypothetical protein
MSAMKKPVQDIPEDEEIDEMDVDEDEEGQDEFEMDEDGIDLVEALGQMLCTEEGETVATALVSLKDSAEKIATQLEMQNKILVKIFGAMKPAAPSAVAA